MHDTLRRLRDEAAFQCLPTRTILRSEVIPAMATTDIDPLRFTAPIRYWNPEKASGLAVADVPAELIPSMGGLKQGRVRGTINAVDFVSNTMPAGGGRLALSVSKAMMVSAGVGVGQSADFEVSGFG
jgi:hypothetical protein